MTLFSAILLLQQAAQPDAAASAAPASSAVSNSAILEMLHNSGPVALIVLGLLLITSLYSWAIILQKWSSFGKARKLSAGFVAAFRKTARLEEVAALGAQFRPSPLVKIFDDSYTEFQRQVEIYGQVQNTPALERAAQTSSSEALTVLESRMTWLATIGAVAPFLGLFGTIWGIIDAFHGLGTAGAATLRAVAPGVSEALITTAAGLAVAVPAVVAYNQFNAQLREFAARQDDFARELLTALEDVPPVYNYGNMASLGTQPLPFPAEVAYAPPVAQPSAPVQQHEPEQHDPSASPYLQGKHGRLPRY